MGLPTSFTVGPLATADADLYVLSATPTSGTAMTLTGAAPAVARRVLLTYGSESVDRTMRITGTNAGGTLIQETLTVPSGGGGTAYTTQDFATVTEAMPGGGTAWDAAVTLGTNTIGSSPWKFSNSQQWGPEQISIGVVVTGTVNYTIEYTYENPNNNANTMGGALGNYPSTVQPWSHPTLVGLTSSDDGFIDNPVAAWRATLNSGTGSIAVSSIESGMH